MAPRFVFYTRDLCKSYGDHKVLDEISLSFYYGAKIGIVGDNGSGKSTLLRIMAGLDKEFKGEAWLEPGMRVKYVHQEPELDVEKTVRQNLELAIAPVHALIARYDEITEKMGEDLPEGEMDKLMKEMGDLQDKIDAVEGWEVDRLLDIASDALVLPPDDALVKTLSGGERRRVALAQALLEKPDLLLLDEPTNHLDAETVAWLEMTLREYHGTVIIVTHDRYFLDNITKWILELEETHGTPFEGNYASWLRQKQEILRVTEKRETQRQKMLAREYEFISSARKWRIQRSQKRITDYESMANQKFEISKDEVMIQIPPGPRLGDKVLEIKNVTKGYNGFTLLDNVSFNMPRGAVVGVIGPNGTGKTTLFKMIVGQEKPDAGTIELGASVQLAYVDQMRETIDSNRTVFEEVCGGQEEVDFGTARKINSRAYLSRFNFRGQQQQKKVGELSGGERNRVHLAKLLKRGGNLILLDEPTNDLDVNTMRTLEEAIIDYSGCAMVISHDRFFLDRVCTHLLIFEGDGKMRWFEGNFAEYEEQVLQKGDRLIHRRGKYKRIKL
jgi:ATP-binding cassette ChvD family protein